jgi:hypothetical protein
MIAFGIWKYIEYGDRKLYSVGILRDGTLHNPNNYPETDVRAAVETASELLHERRSKAAKLAAKTKEKRNQLMVWRVARRLLQNEQIEPSLNCVICGKGLGDQESIARSIGSDCWQHVLQTITKMRAAATIQPGDGG